MTEPDLPDAAPIDMLAVQWNHDTHVTRTDVKEADTMRNRELLLLGYSFTPLVRSQGPQRSAFGSKTGT